MAFPANIDVLSLDGLNGTWLYGSLYDASGDAVASAGDVNGDGFDDVIIHAAGGYGRYINNPGGSYVVFGKAGGLGARVELADLDGSNGFSLSGSSYGSQSVASAGDVNGDGYDDVIVGAPSDGEGGAKNGVSYVVFGKASGFAADIQLSTLNGANGFKLNGGALGNEAGWSVASAGDVNNDGYDDLIIGDTSAGAPGVWPGASYVVFGKAAGFSASMDLSSLNGTNGFAIIGGKAADEGGWSVASAGDVNGDGYDDVIIGARSADPNGDQSGASYVVFGKGSGFTSTLNISTLNGTNGFKLSGGAISDFSGFSVSSAGDLNGDGFADLVVGAPGASLNGSGSGASYVVFGKASGFTANLNLSTLTGSNGFRIVGAPASDSDSLGYSVASAGDFNGDGYDDLIIGVIGDDSRSPNTGASYVVFGKAAGFGASFDVSTLNGANGFKVIGAGGWDMTGWSVASAGDVNNDGYDDLIIGAPQHIAGLPGEGRSYVIYGHAGALGTDQPPPSLAYLDASNGFKLSGAVDNDFTARSVASAGDINGDGFDDVIVGAWRADASAVDSGASYVVFGKAGGFVSEIQLSALNGSDGFKLSGVAAADESGWSVASAGDVNGDGYDDLIVGAALADPNGNSSGASYIVFGKASGFTANFNLSTLNGSNGFKLSGGAASDKSGYSVASAGDFNGDGFDDLVVGAPGAEVGSTYDAGSAYIVYGKASSFTANFNLSFLSGGNGFKLTGVTGAAGTSVAAAGDVNGDGYDDVIVGAPWTGGTGGSYVVFGRASGFGASFALSTLNGSNGFKLSGVATFDRSGTSVASAGDVNGDGFADLIVGAPNASPHGTYSGTSYVVFGKASGFTASIDLSTLNGSNGFRLTGVAANDLSGISVSSAGDFNGDGIDDLVIGASRADSNGIDAGTTYVIFGRPSGFSGEIDLSSLDASVGFALKGGRPGDQSGRSVASAGDVNGDGYDDLIIGAERAMPSGIASGAAYVVFGGALGGTVTTTGTAAAEMLIGGAASDVLTGGGGGDAFHAGAGNDRLVVADLAFRLADGGGGTDTLALSGAGLTLDLTDPLVAAKLEGIERIDLAGSGDNTLIVNQRAVLGGVGAETAGGKHTLVVERDTGDVVQFLEAGWTKTGSVTNADGTFDRWVLGTAEVQVERVAPTTGSVIAGTAGNDVISTTVTVPGQLLATDLADTIDGGAGDDVLDGGGGNDALYGGANNDRLIGGTADVGGTNQLWGGAGNDTASYEGTTGVVHADLAAQAGYVDGVLVDQMNSIENLTGGSGGDVLMGNDDGNVLNGGAGNDVLYGQGGDDVLIGGAVSAGGVNQLWGGSGSDTASYVGTAGPVHADLAAQNAYIAGVLVDQMNSIENLIGGSGDDVLTGDAGANVLAGKLGNDTYVIGDGDTVVEAAGEGADTVRASITYTLGANVENLVLTGTANLNGTGNGLVNVLTGNAGNNRLDGAVGADTMAGGLGDDTYVVDSVADLVIEAGGVGSGTDTVLSSVAFTLQANVESLTLTGVDAINGTGNGLDNWLTGNIAANILSGGLGNDTYVIDSLADTIVEAAGEGTDTVRASITYTLGANVENLVLTGTAMSGTGNGLANVLTGNAGNNLLDGGAGVDTMTGGLGDDTYGVDSIADLVVEDAGGGIDTVRSSTSYTLTANVENLVLTGGETLSGTGNGLDNWLTGNVAANILSGGLGNDTYVIDSLADTIVEAAGEGTDTVRASIDYTLSANLENLVLTGTANLSGTGNGLANVLTGNAGNNLLDGAAGADTMAGGLGDDTYVVGSVSDLVLEDVGAGTDTVRSSISYTLTANVENLVLTGGGTLSGTGNALANNLTGGDGLNVLDGAAGADTMAGGLGNDTYVVDDAGDVVVEAANEGTDTVRAWVDHTLAANVEKIVLQGTAHLNGTGNGLDNGLTGNAGNNQLDGGAGADTMVGGLGDDTYIVDNAGDVASEEADAGLDTVRSSVSLRLRSHVENLVLTGTDNIGGTGNDLANVLTGNAGNNVLDGGTGDDTMAGGAGDDTYVMDVATDKITELVGQGTDTVQASFTYVLRTNFENLTLTGSAATSAVGNAVDNVLTGNAGANVLDGRAGADTMQGGGGDDTYYVENAGDVVIELAGKGTDGVKAWLDYTLGDHVEKLVLQGTDDLKGTGNTLDNTLVGNAGDNVLDGGAGADAMSGEAGDDTYFIDNAGDRAGEDAGEGFDTLFSSLSYVLRPNLEKLVLTGTAHINGVGNAENNILDGNDGDNTLDGRAGADTMTGGLGDDKYVVENAGDVVVELADQGIDSVRSWISYTLGANLEKLTLYGTATLDGTGNDLINTVIGNGGRNILDGGLGSDTLSGEGGGDTFRFSTALGASNVDKILVFDHAGDTIQLDDAVFASLGTGALAAGAFNTGMAATQADDRILFDTASKSLYYDADGVGGGAAIKFATIATLTGALDHTDFFVV